MPLTDKGKKVMRQLKDEYGAKKGEDVFYAMKNSGKLKGVDRPHQSELRRGRK